MLQTVVADVNLVLVILVDAVIIPVCGLSFFCFSAAADADAVTDVDAATTVVCGLS